MCILRSKCEKTPEMLSIKRVRFVVLAGKGTRAVRSSCWKGNIDGSKSALAQTEKMCIYSSF